MPRAAESDLEDGRCQVNSNSSSLKLQALISEFDTSTSLNKNILARSAKWTGP